MSIPEIQPEKPECPECPEDAEYKVFKGMTSKTLMAPSGGYWDEDGEYVPRRDPNVIRTNYRCSNGHEWTETKPADPNYPRWDDEE